MLFITADYSTEQQQQYRAVHLWQHNDKTTMLYWKLVLWRLNIYQHELNLDLHWNPRSKNIRVFPITMWKWHLSSVGQETLVLTQDKCLLVAQSFSQLSNSYLTIIQKKRDGKLLLNFMVRLSSSTKRGEKDKNKHDRRDLKTSIFFSGLNT